MDWNITAIGDSLLNQYLVILWKSIQLFLTHTSKNMKRQGPAGTEKQPMLPVCSQQDWQAALALLSLTDVLTCPCNYSSCVWGVLGRGHGLAFWLSFTTGDSAVSQLLRGDNERLVCGSGCASAEWWWAAPVLWWQQLHHIHEGGGGQVSDELACWLLD